jgi:hypothetical protein
LGAALTYARLYALFTLVGIAVDARRISVPYPSPQWSCRNLIIATNQMASWGSVGSR